MSAVVLVRDSRSGEHFVLQQVEQNGYVTKVGCSYMVACITV